MEAYDFIEVMWKHVYEYYSSVRTILEVSGDECLWVKVRVIRVLTGASIPNCVFSSRSLSSEYFYFFGSHYLWAAGPHVQHAAAVIS